MCTTRESTSIYYLFKTLCLAPEAPGYLDRSREGGCVLRGVEPATPTSRCCTVVVVGGGGLAATAEGRGYLEK